MSRFTERHLDPGSRFGEILFGLIMVLTVTLAAGFNVAEGRKGVRQLLLAAIGSNVAWGIIDALASFWLVFVSCLPAALPFLIFLQPVFALPVSNFFLIAALFYVGQKWAVYAGRIA
jgi:hypothetical protein